LNELKRTIQCIFGVVKVGEEQGWWAGNIALDILGSTAVEDIPISRNEQSKLLINMTLANELGYKIPMDLLENAILWTDESSGELE
jgi:ABC-type uncharacterized transport system substrate-binding protein